MFSNAFRKYSSYVKKLSHYKGEQREGVLKHYMLLLTCIGSALIDTYAYIYSFHHFHAFVMDCFVSNIEYLLLTVLLRRFR